MHHFHLFWPVFFLVQEVLTFCFGEGDIYSGALGTFAMLVFFFFFLLEWECPWACLSRASLLQTLSPLILRSHTFHSKDVCSFGLVTTYFGIDACSQSCLVRKSWPSNLVVLSLSGLLGTTPNLLISLIQALMDYQMSVEYWSPIVCTFLSLFDVGNISPARTEMVSLRREMAMALCKLFP